MNDEIMETLNRLIAQTHALLSYKFAGRKRLNKEEVWERAVTLRDMQDIENWLSETEKDIV